MTTRSPIFRSLAVLLVLSGCNGGNGLQDPAPPPGPPGVQAMSRLNRVEHENSLEDLLGVASDAARQIPEDPQAEGYDTVAAGLVLTPAHAAFYEQVTDEALDRFFGVGGPASPELGRIVSCDIDERERNCAKEVLGTFLRDAWRRPPTDDDVDWAVNLWQTARGLESTPTEALQVAMKGILMAPEFIFRLEPSPAPGEVESLDPFHVATRLAYFLWSSTPDTELLAAAESGALLEDGGIAAQADRMLDDERADALLENFGGQWFDIRSVMGVQPNPEVHAFFDDNLKRSMQLEMLSIAEPFLRGGESFDVVLTREEAYVERRLSLHYRWLNEPDPDGFMSLDGTGRQGILTTAGWLSVTSHPDETSAVRRGQWILEQMLCDPPPPPPPDIEMTTEVKPNGSVREQEEEVRQRGDCASCHSLMDPLGYAFHGYGAVGVERASDRFGFSIDDAVQLDGVPVQGVADVADWLLTDPRLDRCIVQHAFTYALGRAPDNGDHATIDVITEAFVAGGRRFPVIVEHLVKSRSFLEVIGAPEEPAPQEAP